MILIAFGTRPEYIKLKPLIQIFKNNKIKFKTLFTGQHENLIDDIKFDYELKIYNGENRLDSIIQSTMNCLNKKIWDKIKYVLVQGDTTSVLGIALAAFNRNKKIIHLEAGLRTYDNNNPYPEEQNRRLVSQIADIHLCPTTNNLKNLISEKINGEKYVVGNTIIDNLIKYKEKCEYTNKILITMHRRENHHWIDKWFIEINNLAKKYKEYEFIIPLHPNPNIQKHKKILKNVKIINPLNYNDMLNLLIKTRLVITDSGGLQEECNFFNKKCLTCRKVTERPESIGITTFMVDKPENLKSIFEMHINNYIVNENCLYGDGYSSEKIYNIIKKIV